ncbi:MAG: hypothetical protein AAGG68_03970 [Bacteroidota bacterium]
MTRQTHKQWLKFSAIAVFIYALLFFLGSIKGFYRPIELVLDLSNWPLDGAENYDAPTSVFLSAILGGVLFGWGIQIWLLSSLYDKAPEQVRKTVLMSFIAWFLVDSAACILSGNSSNAISNIGLLVVLSGPLWVKAKVE